MGPPDGFEALSNRFDMKGCVSSHDPTYGARFGVLFNHIGILVNICGDHCRCACARSSIDASWLRSWAAGFWRLRPGTVHSSRGWFVFNAGCYDRKSTHLPMYWETLYPQFGHYGITAPAFVQCRGGDQLVQLVPLAPSLSLRVEQGPVCSLMDRWNHSPCIRAVQGWVPARAVGSPGARL